MKTSIITAALLALAAAIYWLAFASGVETGGTTATEALRAVIASHRRDMQGMHREVLLLRQALAEERGRDWRGCYVGTCLLSSPDASPIVVSCEASSRWPP